MRDVKKDPGQRFIDQDTLAARWMISPRTLEQWRWLGKGPRFVKIGGRVRYPVSEIETVEAAGLCKNTNGPIANDDNFRC